LFVLDRRKAIEPLDAERIARAINITRFPPDPAEQQDSEEEGWLVRAADLVGQLGDPHYLRKSNALFYEFEECGLNRQLGYTSPADIVEKYPQFFYNSIAPRIQTAIRYLNVTSSGRQWIANLYSNLFRAEQLPQS
ncbi:MAG TPA: metal-dependent phosphohydrolase, partial [Xanthobacteraceae bacterium]